jgi:hypothetical protein
LPIGASAIRTMSGDFEAVVMGEVLEMALSRPGPVRT